ncbi:MAG: hypothetical protein QGE95_16680, partial [Arenicellales bacterium]|nr:hypothetical protein [Arenicellales bacterium]
RGRGGARRGCQSGIDGRIPHRRAGALVEALHGQVGTGACGFRSLTAFLDSRHGRARWVPGSSPTTTFRTLDVPALCWTAGCSPLT